MVEANPISFSRLVTQRPRTWRAETALCAEAGEIVFAGEGCCSTAVALRESTRAPATAYAVRCTPISALLKATGFDAIDFWSLDTEGSELDVLRGMDWSVPVSVILVESRNPKIHELLTDKGFERHRPRRPLKDTIYVHSENLRARDVIRPKTTVAKDSVLQSAMAPPPTPSAPPPPPLTPLAPPEPPSTPPSSEPFVVPELDRALPWVLGAILGCLYLYQRSLTSRLLQEIQALRGR